MLSVVVPYSDVTSYLHSVEAKGLYYFTALALASAPLLPPIISNEQNLDLGPRPGACIIKLMTTAVIYGFL